LSVSYSYTHSVCVITQWYLSEKICIYSNFLPVCLRAFHIWRKICEIIILTKNDNFDNTWCSFVRRLTVDSDWGAVKLSFRNSRCASVHNGSRAAQDKTRQNDTRRAETVTRVWTIWHETTWNKMLGNISLKNYITKIRMFMTRRVLCAHCMAVPLFVPREKNHLTVLLDVLKLINVCFFILLEAVRARCLR